MTRRAEQKKFTETVIKLIINLILMFAVRMIGKVDECVSKEEAREDKVHFANVIRVVQRLG